MARAKGEVLLVVAILGVADPDEEPGFLALTKLICAFARAALPLPDNISPYTIVAEITPRPIIIMIQVTIEMAKEILADKVYSIILCGVYSTYSIH
jgi:hypothetical protein